MITGKAHFVHRVLRAADLCTRQVADAAPPPFAAVSLSPFPCLSTLRHSRGWSVRPAEMRGACVKRVAHHEAGHVVYMEWLGLEVLGAHASEMGGEAQFRVPAEAGSMPVPADASGALAACAAGLYHAGTAAESLWLGIVGQKPFYEPLTTDYQASERMLRLRFGAHSSAGHGYAFRMALHVLSSRWDRLQHIAERLTACGTFHNTNT